MLRKIGIHRSRIGLALIAAVAALTVVGVALAATVTIDSFNSGTITATANNSVNIVTNTVVSVDAIGGQRDIMAAWNTGANVTLAINAGAPASQAAAYSTDSSTNGYGTITWDGQNDPNTLNFGLNQNLQSSNPANTVYRLRITNNDLPVTVTLRAYTNDPTHYSEYLAKTQGGIVAPQVVDLVFPFTAISATGPDGAATSSDIDAIVLTIDNRLVGSDNADFTVDQFDVLPQQADFGDLPNSYGAAITTTYHLRSSTLRLGGSVDSELDGQPSFSADGDNQASSLNVDDEEGVSRGLNGNFDPNWTPGLFSNGAGGSVDVTVNGQACASAVSSRCYLRGWIDWNDNSILEPSEVIISRTLGTSTSGTTNYSFNVPDPAPACYDGTCYARFRLCGSPTGTRDCDAPSGSSTDGEVEDYAWGFGPLAVTLDSLQAQPTTSPVVPVVLIGVSALALISIVFLTHKSRKRTA